MARPQLRTVVFFGYCWPCVGTTNDPMAQAITRLVEKHPSDCDCDDWGSKLVAAIEIRTCGKPLEWRCAPLPEGSDSWNDADWDDWNAAEQAAYKAAVEDPLRAALPHGLDPDDVDWSFYGQTSNDFEIELYAGSFFAVRSTVESHGAVALESLIYAASHAEAPDNEDAWRDILDAWLDYLGVERPQTEPRWWAVPVLS